MIYRKQLENRRQIQVFVPGLHAIPQYPKQSELTSLQHYQCIKVLCRQNPQILPSLDLAHPSRNDYRVFEQIHEIYAKEQTAYKEWVKTLWINKHCVRALTPKPYVEKVYRAEFNIKAHEMQSFPKIFYTVAQIPLECNSSSSEFLFEGDLKVVNIDVLPQIISFQEVTARFSIMKRILSPEPCVKHPCRFVLPSEKSVSILPLTEIHRELAQYASDNGAQFVASENALKCFIECDRYWTLPVSVCETIDIDGNKKNITVLGSEISVQKDPSRARVYKAFRHMLENAFIPSQNKSQNDSFDEDNNEETSDPKNVKDEKVMSSDDDDDELMIDAGDMQSNSDSDAGKKAEKRKNVDTNRAASKSKENAKEDSRASNYILNKIGVYSCSCEGKTCGIPRRSFKKWKYINETEGDSLEVIVHCSHKARDRDKEVFLEPIPEYQIDVGASSQSQDKIDSMMLSLELRNNAAVLNVRVEGSTGDVICVEKLTLNQLRTRLGNPAPGSQPAGPPAPAVGGRVGVALAQLRGLRPGAYLLRHEPCHGRNALLLSPAPVAGASPLSLPCEFEQLASLDESQHVKTPPVLTDALLPYHKFRRILPCAFTPYPKQVVRERRPRARQMSSSQVNKRKKKKPRKKPRR